MFTGMISRPLILSLVGLTLAVGGGWGAYELRRERAIDPPSPSTEARIPEAAPAAAAPEAPVAAASTTEIAPSAVVAEPADQAAPDPAGEPSAPASSAVAPPANEAPEVAALEVGESPEPIPPEPAAPAVSGPAPQADEAPEVAALEVRQSPEPIPPEPAAPAVSGPAPIEPASAAEPQIAAHAPTETGPPEEDPAGSVPASTEATARLPATGQAEAESSQDASAAGQPERAESAPPPDAPPPEKRDMAALAPAASPEERADEAAAPENLSRIEPEAAPSFDVVRIRPGGAAVIAGRAEPDAEVELRSGDRVIDRVRADRRGEWVVVPQEPLPAGDQQLTLAARVGDRPTVESDEVLVIAVPEPPPQPAPRAGAEPPPPQPATRAGAEPPPPQPPELSASRPPGEPLAVALPRSERGQGRILQAPGRISGDGTLALVVLDYDTTGRIRLRGEAAPGAPVRIYVDNEPAGAAVVEPSGQWSTVLEPTLAPGDYTLRLDQLDPSGKPAARLETPFTRASQPPVEGDVQVDFVIVQPGNSLWRIARRVHGQGMHYVHIYDANHHQIRDPDLIYPGQVLEIPARVGRAG
jgi:nucleoid-associated protein YgaU